MKQKYSNLSLEVFKDGYYDEFVLIDDKNNLKIEKHFIIPPKIKELKLPLIFEDNLSEIEAFITSPQMPFEKEVKCRLELKFAENTNENNLPPYELNFIPLDEKITPLKVLWREIETKKYKKLPFPSFPEKRSWDDLQNDKKGEKNSNLLEWIIEMLEWLKFDTPPTFILKKDKKKILSSLQEGVIVYKQKDKEGDFFYFARLNDGREVFCHSSSFLNRKLNFKQLQIGMKLYLNIEQNKKNRQKLNGYNIVLKYEFENKTLLNELLENSIKEKWKILQNRKSLNEKSKTLLNPLKSIKVPLLKVWSAKTLSDENTPPWFKKSMQNYIPIAEQLFFSDEVDEEIKKELKFFLSAIRDDTTEKFANYLIELSEKRETIFENGLYLALSLGDLKLEWQRKIFENLLSIFRKEPYPQFLKIVSIAIWRSDKFVFYLQKDIIQLLQYLLANLQKVFNLYVNSHDLKYKKTLLSLLELLLGLLFLRKKNKNLLRPDIKLTRNYIKFVNELIKYSIQKNDEIVSRIKIEIKKPQEMQKVPDILFAIRTYLTADEEQSNFVKLIKVGEESD